MSKPLISVKIGSGSALIRDPEPMTPRKQIVQVETPVPSLKEKEHPPVVHQENVRKTPIARKQVRKIRPTSFNLEDPLEKQLSEHADKFSCFSTYIKRLIHKDMFDGNTNASTTPSDARRHDVLASKLTADFGGVK